MHRQSLTAERSGMTSPNPSVLRHCKSCGKDFYVFPYRVRAGLGQFCSVSCSAMVNSTTHGQARSRTYRSWAMMLQRVNNPNYTDFSNYGGAGITVSKEWQESFANFLSDLGERPPWKKSRQARWFSRILQGELSMGDTTGTKPKFEKQSPTHVTRRD